MNAYKESNTGWVVLRSICIYYTFIHNSESDQIILNYKIAFHWKSCYGLRELSIRIYFIIFV